MALRDVKSQQDVESATQNGAAAVLHFWATWCEPCKHMDAVFSQLSSDYPAVSFLRVEAEEVDEVTMKYEVATVPTFVFLQGGKVVDKVEGADPPGLTAKVQQLAAAGAAAAPSSTAAASTSSTGSSKEAVLGRIKYLLTSHPVILFMKGSGDAPRCGFSSRVVEALKAAKAPFVTVDILNDEPLRQGLKEYANWPTYPQLYVKGELVGGCDIITEMQASGELVQLLQEKLGKDYASLATQPVQLPVPAASTSAPAPAPAPAPTAPESKEALMERVKRLVTSKPVMLFMKGTAQEPRCGFSRKVVSALEEIGIEFGSFDILSDEAVRQGLKEYANWPTYPQLYVKGELLGGCDIVLEMQASGELKSTIQEQLTVGKEELHSRIKALVNSHPVMLFMKGTPADPRCGFSRKVAHALDDAGIEFGSFDILSDEAVRQGLKEYGNWPTYPQLYVKGELLGGCDIVLEMQAAGELKTSVEEMLHRMD